MVHSLILSKQIMRLANSDWSWAVDECERSALSLVPLCRVELKHPGKATIGKDEFLSKGGPMSKNIHHSSTSVTHVCTSGQPSGSGRCRRSPVGSVGSGRLLCVPGILDIGRWRGHIFPVRWSPRCRCSHISHMVEKPLIVPGGRHSNRLHTSDSASLHMGKGERSGQELDGWLSHSTVQGHSRVTWVCYN